MGQYHILANLDKNEYVSPYGLGLGAKQYEHTGVENGGLGDALYLLVMTSPCRGGGDWPAVGDVTGRWVGDRVVVLGDYTEDSDLEPHVPNGSQLYKMLKEEVGIDITDEVAEALGTVWSWRIAKHNLYGFHERVPLDK